MLHTAFGLCVPPNTLLFHIWIFIVLSCKAQTGSNIFLCHGILYEYTTKISSPGNVHIPYLTPPPPIHLILQTFPGANGQPNTQA